MKTLTALLLVVCSLFIVTGLPAAASSSPQHAEEAGVRAAIEHYFRGHATGDGAHFRQAFHPSAKLFFIRDGQLTQWTLDEYIGRASGTPPVDAIERLAANAPLPEKSLRKLEYDDRVFLMIEDRSWFLKVNMIKCIAGAGDYSEVSTADGRKVLAAKSLREWEARLPEKYFARIHRSMNINLERIERIESWFNGSYHIHLHQTEQPLIVSRRYAAKLKEKFG